MVIYHWFDNKNDSLITSRGKQSISFDPNFYSYSKIDVDVDTKKNQGEKLSEIPLDITIINEYSYPVDFWSKPR